MPAKRHIHKYRYLNIGTKKKPRKVYACAYNDCTHFMPVLAQVLGKATICWKCLSEAIMDRETIRRRVVHPKCFNCRSGTKKVPEAIIQENQSLDRALDMILQMRGVDEV